MKTYNLLLLIIVFLVLGALIVIIYNFSYKKGFNDGKKYSIEKYILKYDIDTLKITKIINAKQNKKDTLNNSVINISDTSNVFLLDDYYYGYDSLYFRSDSINFNIYYNVKFFPYLKKFFIDLLITDLSIKFNSNDFEYKNILSNKLKLFLENGIDNKLNYYTGFKLNNKLKNFDIILFPYIEYNILNKKFNELNFSIYLLNNILDENNFVSNLGYGINNNLYSIIYFDVIYKAKLVSPGISIEFIKEQFWKTKLAFNFKFNIKN